MSKLGCPCGYTISDNTDNLPYKGLIIRDQDYESVFDSMSEDIAAFIRALLEGKRQEWLGERYSQDYAGLNLEDSEVVHDLITGYLLRRGLDIYQCERCGRIHIEDRKNKNHFFPFSADLENATGVLSVDSKKEEDGDRNAQHNKR